MLYKGKYVGRVVYLDRSGKRQETLLRFTVGEGDRNSSPVGEITRALAASNPLWEIYEVTVRRDE